jgi:hypothetical protein
MPPNFMLNHVPVPDTFSTEINSYRHPEENGFKNCISLYPGTKYLVAFPAFLFGSMSVVGMHFTLEILYISIWQNVFLNLYFIK